MKRAGKSAAEHNDPARGGYGKQKADAEKIYGIDDQHGKRRQRNRIERVVFQSRRIREHEYRAHDERAYRRRRKTTDADVEQ